MILTLRDTVPKMIVVAEGLDEIARLRNHLAYPSGERAFVC
jgi:hypothetical protein